MAIKLNGLTSQKAIDCDSLKYPREYVIFNARILNLKILQILFSASFFFFFGQNLNHRSIRKSSDPRATCGPLFIQRRFKPL
jgi:hypothetical protein